MNIIITQKEIDSALQEANHNFNIEVIGRFNAKYQLGYKAGQILRNLFMADSELIKTLNKYMMGYSVKCGKCGGHLTTTTTGTIVCWKNECNQ